MPEIRIENQSELVRFIKISHIYVEFREKQLDKKIKREEQAWNLIKNNRSKYSKSILDQIFDTVDFYDGKKCWFGSLLATPNRNLIFESSLDQINDWIEKLVFSSPDAKDVLNNCLNTLKIKGASKGVATLFLYLSDPKKYNIWVNKTQEGLYILNLIGDLKGKDWGDNYDKFNKGAISFRDKNHFLPQEIDWVLTFIASYVESDNERFLIDEDVLKTKVPLSVDDESEIDDLVGEPMELQVMRWTPTNEMGVVALFIEFRRELGFPIIEIIRTSFPDAAVFESSSKGYIRKYIEFEFRSSGYKSHIRSKRKCDYVVCWEHDWKDCPMPVRELKTEVPKIIGKEK